MAAIADEIAGSGVMAFDIEFVSEDRYIPELGLVQVAWGDPAAPRLAMIDCVAADPGPLFELVASPDVDTVAHAARQDLGLLAVRFEIAARALWDTQIAAAFVGLGDQVGYGRLVEELLGVRLDKAMQFTNWLKRPLSAKQLRYAVDDVRYLLPVWAELRRQLDERGRADWVRDECDRLAAVVGPLTAADEAYRDVRGWRGLRGSSLAALRALAAWRQTEAVASNKPPSWILPDRAMVEVCQKRADSERALRSVRGIGEGTTRRYGKAILHQIDVGRRQEPPPVEKSKRPNLSPRAQVWATMVANLVQGQCAALGVAPRFVATRAEAEILADWYDHACDGRDRPGAGEPDVDLLTGWRRELVGDNVLAWLRGETAIRASASQQAIELIELPGDPPPDRVAATPKPDAG